VLAPIVFAASHSKHVHNHGGKERTEDGAFSPRDHAHFDGGKRFVNWKQMDVN